MINKKSILTIVLILTAAILFCSCGTENAKSFTEAPAKKAVIEQSYKNVNNNIIYHDGRLYAVSILGTNYEGLYAVDENGVERVKNCDGRKQLFASLGNLFEQDDELYFWIDTLANDEVESYRIDGLSAEEVEDLPDESSPDEMNSFDGGLLKVGLKDISEEKSDLLISYNGEKPYRLAKVFKKADYSARSYCVDGSTVYFVTDSDSLYKYDAKTKDNPERFLYLDESSNDLFYAEGYIYYTCEDGIKRYSSVEHKTEEVCDFGEPYNLAYSMDGKAYYCTDGGIYVSDKEQKIRKYLDINVISVYNYGEKYLYFNTNSGSVFQLERKTNKLRVIPLAWNFLNK